ncbi:FabD/lysophospholipase-like protein [Hypoxylon sp. FL1284]|nr:FabD/lysophospholipase-like protein [Hypoxylon sp. FL1284]
MSFISNTIEMDLPLSSYHDNSDDYKDSPWARKTVLAFDGRRIRGYSSLLVLERLMTRIVEIERERDEGIQSSKAYPWSPHQTLPADMTTKNTTPVNEMAAAGEAAPARETDMNRFLPCDYFDYVVGTSTGGLSAIMLGRLRMSVDEALKQYSVFGNDIFGRPRWWHGQSVPLWWPRAKYSTRKTREAFKRIITNSKQRGNNEQPNMEPFKYRDNRTRTIVFSWSIRDIDGSGAEYIWRTYDHESDELEEANEIDIDGIRLTGYVNPSPAHTAPIWQIARATSAAPTYFEPIQIGDEEHADGAAIENNPSLLAVKEIHRKHRRAPQLFLSIGCGLVPRTQGARRNGDKREEVDTRGRFDWVRSVFTMTHRLGKYILDPERTKRGWEEECETIHVPHRCRLNVEGELSSVRLNEWLPSDSGLETIRKIRRETEKYLERQDIKDHISRMATILVDIRRERSRTVRWESFALDAFYYCNSCGLRFSTRDDFKRHVKHGTKHGNLPQSERERILNEGRRGETI